MPYQSYSAANILGVGGPYNLSGRMPMYAPQQQVADAHRRLAVAPKKQILTGEKDFRFLSWVELLNSIQMFNQILRFVGTYKASESTVLKFRREGDHLMSQRTGQAWIVKYPMSDTQFFAKVAEATDTFVVDEQEHTTGLIHR